MVKKRLILWFWGVIVIPISVVITVLAGINGELGVTIRTGILSMLATVCFFYMRTNYRPQGILLRFWGIITRTLCILALIIGIVGLTDGLINDFPLHFILNCVLLVLIGGVLWLLRIDKEFNSPH